MTAPGRLDLSDRVIAEPRHPGGHQACGGDLALPAGDDRATSFLRLVLPPDRPLLPM